MYELRSTLRNALDEALKGSEANGFIGVISEQGTVVVIPFFECEQVDLERQAANFIVKAADRLGEGMCVGMYVFRDDN
jgi:hypothetical protein